MLKKTYSIEEFKQLIKNDNKEMKKFKKFISTKYNDTYISANFDKNENEDKLLKWFFHTSPTIYQKEIYVKCHKKISQITFKKEHFTKVQIYKDDSNLDIFILIIGKYRKYFLTLEETIDELNNSFENGLFNLPKKSINIQLEGETTDKYFKTEDDFCSNYIKNGKESCLGMFRHGYSNLDICSITLAGDDDYSITQDFLTYNEGIKVWNTLINNTFVNQSDLPNNYFSN